MFAVTDIESSGLNTQKHEIVSIATVIADENFKEVGRFYGEAKPVEKKQWTESAEEIHGFSWEHCQDFDDHSDVISRYNDFLLDHKTKEHYTFVCHARPTKSVWKLFDHRFVFEWYRKYRSTFDFYKLFHESKVVTTIRSDRRNALQEYQIENQKLDTWARKLGIEFQHHNSLSDAMLTLEVLKYQKGVS